MVSTRGEAPQMGPPVFRSGRTVDRRSGRRRGAGERGSRALSWAALALFMLSSALLGTLLARADAASAGLDGAREAALERVREPTSSAGYAPVILLLAEQPDFEALHDAVRGLGRQARRAAIAGELRALAARTQEPVRKALDELAARGEVRNVRPLWFVNGIAAGVSSGARRSLESLPEILLIEPDRALVPPGNGRGTHEPGYAPSALDTSWAIHRVRADRVWELGFRGQGAVVGMIDTGVNYEHLDLVSRMWINGPEDINNNNRFDNMPDSLGGDLNGIDDGGNGFVDDVLGWDFKYEDPDPMDDHGHGTATASIVAGDGWAGTATGLAPEARIMVLKVQLTSQFIASMEYAVANGVDLLSSSLVIPCHPTPSYTLRLAGNTLLASWTVLSQAAGNEGGLGGQYCYFPPPDEIDPPADVPAPWYPCDGSGIYFIPRHSGVLAVGATLPEDTVAHFSSRGPTDWDLAPPFDDYPFPPGLAKPDVAAPGTGLPAALLTSNWGYNYDFSGTSAAAPVNAGVIALMMSATPSLSPVEIDSILEATAFDIDPPGRDSSAGAGRIDAYRAVGTIHFSYPETDGWTIIDEGGDGDGRAEPGEIVDWVITIIDSLLWLPSEGLSCRVSTGDPQILIHDSTAVFGDIGSGETGDNADDPFVFSVTGGPVRWALFYLRKADETGVVPDNVVDTLQVLIGQPPLIAVDDDGAAGFSAFYHLVLRDSLDLVYDAWDVASQGSPCGMLSDAEIVFWFTGAAVEGTLTPADQICLAEFLDGGGDLVLSGENVAQQIASRPFFLDYLHASFDSGATNDTLILGVAGDPVGEGLVLARSAPSSMDVVSPASGGSTMLTYEGGGGAGVRFEGGYRSLFFAFAPELLREPSPGVQGGGELIRRALSWFGLVQVAKEPSPAGRAQFLLRQNAPNPVEGATSIAYAIPVRTRVRLGIYNVQGQRVRELLDGPVSPGLHRVVWDGSGEGGRRLASGIYFYCLEAAGERRTRKMVLLH